MRAAAQRRTRIALLNGWQKHIEVAIVNLINETKAKAQVMLADLGMDLSTAVNIFLKQMLREGGIPFAITKEVPNKITLDAMREAQEMLRSPEKYKSYTDVDSMMEDIL